MLKSKLMLPLAASLGLAAFSAMGAVEYSVIEVETAPPAMRVESAPVLREGYVWIPGYWDYRERNYNWIDGHFEAAREGYVYVAPRYEQRDGRWRMYAGGWDRRGEEEHGGVRNRIKNKINGRDDD